MLILQIFYQTQFGNEDTQIVFQILNTFQTEEELADVEVCLPVEKEGIEKGDIKFRQTEGGEGASATHFGMSMCTTFHLPSFICISHANDFVFSRFICLT
jgi:hypothetical protein